MRPLIYLFTGITALGLFFLIGGLAASHGHFRFRPHQTEDWIIFGTPVIGLLGLIYIWSMKDNIYKESERLSIQGSMEYYELMESLLLAIEKLKNIHAGAAGDFASTTEFVARLQTSRDHLQRFELIELNNLSTWFAPAGVWDEYTGEDGIDLGTKVFGLTQELRSKVK